MLNPRSKLRDRIREATDDAILSAAEAQFAEKGLAGAKVDDIAAQAGVSVGTLYNHFPDREGLVSSVLRERKTEMLESVDEVLARDVDKPFADQLESFLRTIFIHFDDHFGFFQILFQAELQCGKAPMFAKPQEAWRALYERIEIVVKRGLDAGALRRDLAEILASMLIGVVRSALVMRLYNNGGALASQTPQLAEFFVNGAGVRDG